MRKFKTQQQTASDNQNKHAKKRSLTKRVVRNCPIAKRRNNGARTKTHSSALILNTSLKRSGIKTKRNTLSGFMPGEEKFDVFEFSDENADQIFSDLKKTCSLNQHGAKNEMINKSNRTKVTNIEEDLLTSNESNTTDDSRSTFEKLNQNYQNIMEGSENGYRLGNYDSCKTNENYYDSLFDSRNDHNHHRQLNSFIKNPFFNFNIE